MNFFTQVDTLKLRVDIEIWLHHCTLLRKIHMDYNLNKTINHIQDSCEYLQIVVKYYLKLSRGLH